MKIEMIVDTRALKKMERSGKPVMEAVAREVGAWAVGVHSKILANLTGKKLKVRTGRLRSGQQLPRVTRGFSAVKTAFINRVEYAGIHEYGGTTPPHVIVPKLKKALKFRKGADTIFAKKVNHPGSKIKEKQFTREPIHAGLPALKSAIEAEIQRVLNGE